MAERAHTTPAPIARKRAARPAGAMLDRRLPATIPADPPAPLTALDRLRIASNIDMLIDFLDQFDPDPDLDSGAVDDLEEDEADSEPDLGWTCDGQLGSSRDSDLESDGDVDDERNGDDEPQEDDIEPDFSKGLWRQPDGCSGPSQSPGMMSVNFSVMRRT